MSNPPVTHKIQWIDNLKVVAIIGVILTHVSNSMLHQYGNVADSWWWISLIIAGSVRYCVPVFLMISGVLLLDKIQLFGTFIKKRFSRVLLPFLFWSSIYLLVYLGWMMVHNQQFFTSETFDQLIFKLRYGAEYHLWYIYMLIGIYLFVPIISTFISF